MDDRWDDKEWFRSSTWDDSIAAAFEDRLRRARTWNRAQYLRIHGCHLAWQDDPVLRETGRKLFRRVVEEYGDSGQLQATWAMENLAEALSADGRMDEAETVTRELLHRRDADPTTWRGARVDLDLSLAEILLERGTPNALHEADQWLDRGEASVERSGMFRNLVLRHLVTRARVARARGDIVRSVRYASDALQVAEETEPSIPRHPDVGRPEVDEELLAELRTLHSGA